MEALVAEDDFFGYAAKVCGGVRVKLADERRIAGRGVRGDVMRTGVRCLRVRERGLRV